MPGPSRTLVSRDRELAGLAALLDDALTGKGTLAVVVGEAGIGKTRLVDEVSRIAEGRGALAAWGRAWEAGGAPAYFPWTQVFRALESAFGKAAMAEWAGARLADLAELLGTPRGEEPVSSRVDPGSARFRLFDAVSEVLRRASERRPLLVALDDLHAADPSSLSLLHFVARNLRTSRILVIATRRDADARLTPETRELLARIAREGAAFSLGRLSPEGVEELAGGRLSRMALTRLHAATEGNPLFVVEYLRLVDEQGATPGSAVLPEGVADALAGRLAMLDGAAREALSVASVLGREFLVSAVATLSGSTAGQVRGSLAPAAAARIVTDEGDGKFRFSHILFREALHRDLPSDRRAVLHERAATLASSETERAHHLFAAAPRVPVEEAVRAAREAARRALALLAFEDAVVLLEQSASASESDTDARAELLLELAEARYLAGASQAGKEAAKRAADIARARGDAELLARSALTYGSEFSPGVVDATLVSMLGDALSRLPAGASALRARALARLAGAEQPCRDPAKPMETAREAIRMARALADEGTLLEVLHTGGSALADFADPSERAALNREAASIAERRGEKGRALRAYARLVFDELERGAVDESDRCFDRYESIARELARPHHLWPLPLHRAMRALMEGRFAAAAERLRDAEAIARSADDPRFSLCHVLHRFGAARLRWDERALAALADEIRATLASLPGPLGLYSAVTRAGIAAQLGDETTARECLGKVETLGFTIEGTWLAEAAILTKDRRWAERLLATHGPHRGRLVCWGMAAMICEGAYTRTLGGLAAFLGRDDEARGHFDDALDVERRLGLRPALARTLFEYGTYLRESARPGERDRAGALLAEASRLADELDLSGLRTRLRDATAARPASPGGAPTLEREGEYWTLRAGSELHRFKDTKGFGWLAALLARPGEEIHVLDLAVPEGAGVIDGGDSGSMIDREAIAAYRRRLEDLRLAAEEAASMNDRARERRARDEMEAIAEELSRGTSLGGKERRTASAVERARVNATRRVRDAIRRIEEQSPELGRTLDAEIRTGVYFRYAPGVAPNKQK